MWGGYQEILRFLLNYLQLLLVCGLCVFRLHFCLLEMVNMLFWPKWLLKSCHFSACRSFWVALKPAPYYMTFRVTEALGPFTRQDSLVYNRLPRQDCHTTPFSPSGGVSDCAASFQASTDKGRTWPHHASLVFYYLLFKGNVLLAFDFVWRNSPHKMLLIVQCSFFFFWFVVHFFSPTPWGTWKTRYLHLCCCSALLQPLSCSILLSYFLATS